MLSVAANLHIDTRMAPTRLQRECNATCCSHSCVKALSCPCTSQSVSAALMFEDTQGRLSNTKPVRNVHSMMLGTELLTQATHHFLYLQLAGCLVTAVACQRAFTYIRRTNIQPWPYLYSLPFLGRSTRLVYPCQSNILGLGIATRDASTT